MRETYQEIIGRIVYQVPLYKIGAKDFGFWATKTHFAFHAIDYDVLVELRVELPNPGISKANVNIMFDDLVIRPWPCRAIDEIVRLGALPR